MHLYTFLLAKMSSCSMYVLVNVFVTSIDPEGTNLLFFLLNVTVVYLPLPRGRNLMLWL